MISPLHLLLAAPEPAEAVLGALRRAGYDPRPRFVTHPEALGEHLHRGGWDVLVVQHGLPNLSSWDALAWAGRQGTGVPVVVVTDEADDSATVALLQAGAHDVVSDPGRLGVVVAKALRRRKERERPGAEAPSADAVFRDLAEHMPIGLYRTTEQGRILYANPAFARLLGRASVDELLGEAVTGMMAYPRDEFTERLRADGQVQNYEAWWEREGEAVCTRENTRAVRDAEGRLLYYEGTIEDITEERRALHALRDREASLRAIAETTGLVFYRRRAGRDGYDHVSASIATLTGYAPDALAERGGLDSLIGYREAVAGGEAEASLALYRLRTAEGAVRWVEDSAHPWTDEAGDVIGRAGVLRDVTEQREREAAERAQSARRLDWQKVLTELSAAEGAERAGFRPVTEAAARAVGTGRASLWLLDEAAGEVQCRDLYLADADEHRSDPPFRAEAMAGTLGVLGRHRVVAAADVLAKPPAERFGLDVYHARHGVRAVLSAAVRRQDRVVGFLAFEHTETRTWTGDEQDFAVALADLVALKLEQARRGEAEAALGRSERRYRAISELAADYAYALCVEADGHPRIAWATAALERVTGYTPTELADAQGLLALVHGDDRPGVDAALPRLDRAEDVAFECRIRTKSGDERWVAQRSRSVRDEDGTLWVYASGRDVTPRKAFEHALVEARAEAEDSVRQKSEFLASMSHEIRTPLTALLGFAGVLAEEVGEEHREFATLIETSGRRLMETVNSVLDLARIESDRKALAPEPLDVAAEIRQAVRLLAPLADEKGLALGLDESDAEVIAPVDRTCLHRILNNLIGNAIKFTERGEVAVGVRSGGDHIRLWVRDTGVGIDETFLPHLFEEFQQEAEGHEVGSGLGLAITQRLASLIGGTISVESRKGEGSTFTLSFPRVFDEGQVEQAVGLALVTGEAAQQRSEAADPQPRVLVVEDCPEARHLTERILGGRYRVDAAAEAGAARALLAETVYDALVIDLHLGGGETGLDVLRAARALPGYAATVALALTAHALPGDGERFLDAGFDAYLSKPFAREDLVEALQGIGVAAPEP